MRLVTTNWLAITLALLAVMTEEAAAAAPATDDFGTDPREYFKALLEERTSIKYLHVELSVTILKDTRFHQLEGCRNEIEGWYDFETGTCRVDQHVACPKDQQLDRDPRFSFDGNVYRVILRDDILGYELHGFDRHYKNTAKSFVFDQSTDLRLLGLFPAPYSVLKNMSLADLSTYVNGPKDLTFASSNGRPIIEVNGFLTPNLSATLDIDVESHMPNRIETRIGSKGQRRELQCTWKKYSRRDEVTGIWFPTTVRTRTWEDGVTLSEEDLVDVKAVDIGQPPSKSLYEWKSLEPVDGFVVEFRQDDNRRVKVEEWDADKATFVTWTPTPLAAQATEDIDADKSGLTRWWLIVANIVVIAGIVVWLIISRRLIISRQR